MARAPLFPRTVDDVTTRLVAAEVLCMSLAAVALRAPWLFGVLAVDFTVRTATGPRWSPLARAAGLIRPRLRVPPRPTPGPPKRFAAAIGMVLTILIPVLAYAGAPSWLAWGVAALMVVFPALEALAGICVGCIVFSALMRVGVVPETVCLECADISLRRRAA